MLKVDIYSNMEEIPLVQAILREEAGAWEAFVHRYGNLVYNLSSLVFSNRELETEYLNIFSILRQKNFTLLRTFLSLDGHVTLSTYLTLTLSNLS